MWKMLFHDYLCRQLKAAEWITMKDSLDFKAIGKRIRKMRQSKNLSQEQLANQIDTTPAYVSAIETGASKVSLTSIVAIANAFECSVDVLLFESSKYAFDKYDFDAMLILQDCSESERQFLLRLLQYTKTLNRENKEKNHS